MEVYRKTTRSTFACIEVLQWYVSCSVSYMSCVSLLLYGRETSDDFDTYVRFLYTDTHYKTFQRQFTEAGVSKQKKSALN